MRRWFVVALSVVGILGFLAPTADAQTPKVTINGLVDQVTSWSRNMSVTDLNYDRTDSEWYARTRVRPDITAEVGTTKFVLGLEIDAAWGQVGAQDTNVCVGAACPAANPQRSGSTGSWDLNTDTIGQIEVKWAYTEFDVPWVPGARLRLGAQPWQATYKLAVLANGDYAGTHLTWAVTPAIRTHMAYAQIEENSQEPENVSGGTGTGSTFLTNGLRAGARSEDFATVISVEITPFKGLDIRPLYSYARFDGTTSGSSRAGRGGIANAAPVTAAAAVAGLCAPPGGGATESTVAGVCPTAGNVIIVAPTAARAAAAGYAAGDIEDRHTIGVDARLRLGPISVDPTVLYQFGRREVTVPSAAVGGPTVQSKQDLSAWLIDIRAGFQAGPLLVEGAFIYTTGDKAGDDVTSDVNYYQPISTDTSFYAGWANIFALGIDYFNILYSGAGGLNPGNAIGYDKYGLIRAGLRASYALTPTFTPYMNLTASWTEEKVDTTSTIAAGSGLTPRRGKGDEDWLGFEVNAGFTWRIAPNLAFDLVGGYLFAGDALAHSRGNAGLGIAPAAGCNSANTSSCGEPEDVKTAVARFRFTF